MTLHDRKMKKILYERQGHRCNAPCEDYGRGLGILLPERLLELDHIVSGGSNGIENRQLLCSDCNRSKGKRGMTYLLNRLKMKKGPLPLFASAL